VADGRKLKRDDVHEIAQGRVWSGRDALGIKLVDKFGGLRDAIKEAATRATLTQAEWVQIPALNSGRESLLQKILSDGHDENPMFAKASADRDPVLQFLRAHADTLKSIRALNDPKGVYLTCPLILRKQ
jgi:protease-4